MIYFIVFVISIILFLVILVAALAVVLIKYKPRNKGKRGENMVASVLGDTIPGEQYIINNLLFTNDSNHSCQIDHIFINKHGIWVIETKNYSGTIYGNEEQREWTQVLAYGNMKNKLYNPVKQNQTHIYHLSQFLKVKNIFINIVVFTNNADIKNINSLHVIEINDLNKIKSEDTGITLTTEQMESYYNKLSELKNSNQLTEKEHIKNINTQQKQLKKGICPRCGGKLVLRDGKYGKFYGCSNYPKCKFTKDI